MPRPKVCCRDGAKAIANAISVVFGDVKQCNCWAHVQRNYEKRLSDIRPFDRHNSEELDEIKSIKARIDTDIHLLQLSPSSAFFEEAARLFVEHWSIDERCRQFIDYFTNQYIADQTMNKWYEGYVLLTPSTNNGNESGNAQYKRLFTSFCQTDIMVFLHKNHNDALPFFSNLRNPTGKNYFKYKFEPNVLEVPNSAWNSALNFVDRNVKMRRNSGMYVWCRDEKIELTLVQAAKLCEQFLSGFFTKIEEFREFMNNYHFLTRKEGRFNCSCKLFLKEYYCRHSLAMEHQVNKKEVPSRVLKERTRLGPKKKKGRPAKDKPALEMQPSMAAGAPNISKKRRKEEEQEEEEDEEDVEMPPLEQVEPEEPVASVVAKKQKTTCACKTGCKNPAPGSRGRQCSCRKAGQLCLNCTCLNCSNK